MAEPLFQAATLARRRGARNPPAVSWPGLSPARTPMRTVPTSPDAVRAEPRVLRPPLAPPPPGRGEGLARRRGGRALRRRAAGLDAARLCGARPRGLPEQRRRAPRGAARRRGGGGAAAVAVEGGRIVDAHPLLALLRRPTRARAARASSRASTGTSSCRATPISRRSRSTARRASSTRCGPTACASCRGRTAGRPPMTTRSAPRPCASCRRARSPPILHLTLFHPTDDHYGLSPMEAAAVPLDIHNAAGAWNKALLDNAARPSGALVFASGASGAAIERGAVRAPEGGARGELPGRANAGRPLLLEGGLDWKPLSLTPKDMDFVEAKNAAAREIALAFGVPPLLLGLARRQHPRQLRRGEPRLLPPDRDPARRAAPPRRSRNGCARLWRRPRIGSGAGPCLRARPRRHRGARRRARDRSGGASAPPISSPPTRSARRWAMAAHLSRAGRGETQSPPPCGEG